MLDQLRDSALALVAATATCTLSTNGPAGLQASAVVCRVCEDCVYILVPRTLDHLFNIQHESQAVLTGAQWHLRGAALELSEAAGRHGTAPQHLIREAKDHGCCIVEVFPLQMHVEPGGMGKYRQTIDFYRLSRDVSDNVSARGGEGPYAV